MLNFKKSGDKSRAKKARSGKRNAGFFAAVGLCCAAVCLAGISSIVTERREAQNDQSQLEDESNLWTFDESQDYLDADTQPSRSDAIAVVGSENQSTGQTPPSTTTTTAPPPVQDMDYTNDEAIDVAKSLVYDPPLPGAVLKEFSGTELVYCTTMGDWRVHRGVDIAGETGCEVYSAADGKVVSISEDPLYGTTVAIGHSDDSVIYYCGLSGTLKVKKGQKVSRGQQIGFLGELPCESDEPPHLHMEMTRGGEYVDPMSMY